MKNEYTFAEVMAMQTPDDQKEIHAMANQLQEDYRRTRFRKDLAAPTSENLVFMEGLQSEPWEKEAEIGHTDD